MQTIDPSTVESTTAAPATTATDKAAEPAPQVAVTVEAVKAARYEAANKAIADAHTASQAKIAADAVAAKESEVAKAKEADTAGKTATELAEAKAKLDLLAPKAAKAAVLEQVEALVKAGKHYDAIQYLAESTGVSFDQAVQQVMNPGQEPTPAPVKPEDKPVDPEVAVLKEQVKRLSDRVADADAKEAAAVKEAGRKSVVEHVKTAAKDYPFLASNEDWVTEALLAAEPEYAKAIELNKGQDIPIEAKEALIVKHLQEHEAKHKANAAKYLAVANPAPAAKNPNDVPRMTNATLNITAPRAGVTPAAKPVKNASLEDLKRARRQAN